MDDLSFLTVQVEIMRTIIPSKNHPLYIICYTRISSEMTRVKAPTRPFPNQWYILNEAAKSRRQEKYGKVTRSISTTSLKKNYTCLDLLEAGAHCIDSTTFALLPPSLGHFSCQFNMPR